MFKRLFGFGGSKEEDTPQNLGQKFNSIEEATDYFDNHRTKKLQELEQLSKNYTLFTPTYEAKSLIGLETLYCEIYYTKKQKKVISKSAFEELINYYNAAVFIHYGLGEWEVQGDLFSADQYIDGIYYAYGS